MTYQGKYPERCPHGVMWGDRTDLLNRDGKRKCEQCEYRAELGRLLQAKREARS